jgi:hypothetical protein
MSKYERHKYRSMRLLMDIAQKKQPSAKYVPAPIKMPLPFIDMSHGYQAYMEQKNQKAMLLLHSLTDQRFPTLHHLH